MSAIFLVVISCVIYFIYYFYKSLQKQEEEREEGYHGAIYRYRYTHEASPFSYPQTPFEEGWNQGIEVIKEVTEDIG